MATEQRSSTVNGGIGTLSHQRSNRFLQRKLLSLSHHRRAEYSDADRTRMDAVLRLWSGLEITAISLGTGDDGNR